MAEKSSTSTWGDILLPQFPSLTEDTRVDVAIIGGGITGITAAYLLSEAGYSVAILEQGKLASDATRKTTAFLTQYIDTDVAELIPMFGKEKAKEILDSHARAIDAVEQIVAQEKIACEFTRCPHYIYSTDKKDDKHLQAEEQAAAEVGLKLAFNHDSNLPLSHSAYLTLPNQAKFHPLKYLAGIIPILRKRGVRIYEDTKALGIKAGNPAIVRTDDHAVRATYVIVATHAPFNKKLFFKKAFYTSYVLEAELPSGSLPEAMYEDTYNPYHYFRVDRRERADRLIFGGADHRSDIAVPEEKSFQALENTMSATFEGVPFKLVRRWKGPIIEPVDGIASIGPVNQDNVLYATGFSGNGMTYATIAATLLVDLVMGRENPWLDLYDARRLPTAKQLVYKGYDYTQELFGGAVKNAVRLT